MSLYVRKINKAKWLQYDILNGEEPSADAITNCIKTKDNTLSVWSVEDENSVDQAVLAIVAAGDNMDTIDIVMLPAEKIAALGITFTATDGLTPITSLVKTHIDLDSLNYISLGKVASCVTDAFREQKVIRYSKAMIKSVLVNALASGILDISTLNEPLRTKLN